MSILAFREIPRLAKQWLSAGRRMVLVPQASVSSDRSYPAVPRVGIGVVALRKAPNTPSQIQILMVKRNKSPGLGEWCFPGGGLELGETNVDCAVRECLEETGVQLQTSKEPVRWDDNSLKNPRAFAAADVIVRDDQGGLEFHYAIIEVQIRPHH
eukprot:jgi/Botrbrau1/21910/Bobra.0249s0037.2